MAERICLLTGYPTDCTVGCYKCDCGGDVTLNDCYVSIYDVQRVCDIEGVAAETEEGEYLAEVIRNNLEQMAVVKADVQPVNQWISVNDRLPEKDGNYLCYLECGDVCQSAFDSTIASDGEAFPFGEWVGVYDSETLGFKDSYWEEHDAITHWMPLPEPPKDGEQNG